MSLQRRTPLRAKTELGRSTPLGADGRPIRKRALKRSRGISPATPAQRAAVEGRACIVCASHPCDPAHVIDRSMAPSAGDDPRATVPLCRRCHELYDDGSLDLSPYLEPHWRSAVAWAVEAVGLFRAVRRITKRSWAPVEDAQEAA